MIRKLLCVWLIMLASIGLAGEAAYLSAWHTDYHEAMREARDTDRPVLLVFSGSDWCRPCIQLKREVLDTKEFVSYSEDKLVLLKADFPRYRKNQLSDPVQKQNDQLAEKYNPGGQFPWLVLLRADGHVISESGYQAGGTEVYIDYLQKAITKKTTP